MQLLLPDVCRHLPYTGLLQEGDVLLLVLLIVGTNEKHVCCVALYDLQQLTCVCRIMTVAYM